MPPELACDLIRFLEKVGTQVIIEIAIASLKSGDRLVVRTRNTRYYLAIIGPGMAFVTSNRTDRPMGIVQLRGCVFGHSGVIKPDHLFCGGGLEMSEAGSPRIHITSAIETMDYFRALDARGAN